MAHIVCLIIAGVLFGLAGIGGLARDGATRDYNLVALGLLAFDMAFLIPALVAEF